MDIVMLAAGTSSRMGATNKMLLPYNGTTMVAHSCLQALQFLQEHALATDTACTLIVVTGYRRQSVEKALADCKAFVERTSARLEMLIVNNPDYRKGQYTSTKVGVSQVREGQSFFISLADMPLIGKDHYAKLVPMLQGHDAVRPFYLADGADRKDRVPGHPVLHSYCIKKAILDKPDDYKVNRVLKDHDVLEVDFSQRSWALDIDVPESYQNLIS